MKLSDDAKKQALEAAHGVKGVAGAQTLWPKAETTQEMETGSPRTPGYQPNYGQTMKPTDREAEAPQWPQAKQEQPKDSRESAEQNRDREAAADRDIDR
jgi:hypothetical protein